MNLVKKILQRVNGLYYRQEYLCVGQHSIEQPLHVYLLQNNLPLKDVTYKHVFIGYSPLVFALPAEITTEQHIELCITREQLIIGKEINPASKVASLQLKKIEEQPFRKEGVMLYEGVHATHKFVSTLQQQSISIYNRLYHKKAGNVFLHNNLYKQVQVAYSIPRNISLITVGRDGMYNLFPTDLHGPLDKEHYLISLRHQGKACKQVNESGSLLISEINLQAFRDVYALGKNHMQDLKTKEHFRFSPHNSPGLGLPIPDPVLSWRELALLNSFNHGIHKIMIFKQLQQKVLETRLPVLAHIHNVYATWRQNQGLPGNYLIR